MTAPTLFTFDIFGTVLDWRTGLERAADLAPGDFDRIVDCQAAMKQTSPGRRYADITADSLVETIGLAPDDAARIGAGVGNWPLFADSADALATLRTIAPCGAMTNSDRVHGEQVQAQLGFALDTWLCAEEVGVYKPDPRFWEAMAAVRGIDFGPHWWHVSAYTDYDLAAARAFGLTAVFVARPHARPGPADLRVDSLAALAELLS